MGNALTLLSVYSKKGRLLETTQDAFALSDQPVHLNESGRIVRFSGDDQFWQQLRDQPELRTGWLVSVFRYDRSWNRWERHPDADELVTVIEGAVDFEFDDRRRWRVSVTAGASCVVPQMVWHRAVFAEPTVLMFITPAPAVTEGRALV